MSSKNLDRLFFCLANCLIYIGCIHDLFIVKYHSNIHVISRGVLIFILIVYVILIFLTRIFPLIFLKIFHFFTSFFLSLCLSLTIFTYSTTTITNLFLLNFLFILSICCFLIANFFRLIHHSTFHFIHFNEFAELIGFSFGFYLTVQDQALYYLLLAFFILIITLRLRAFHSFMLLILNLIYFYNFYSPYTYIGCICFLVRLISRPIIELYFISLTSLERWIFLLQLSKIYRKSFQRLMICLYYLVPFHCIYIIGQTIRLHNEWFIIVPMFVLCLISWIVFRSLTFSLLWMLSNKLIECYLIMLQTNLENEKHKISLIKLMASKGIRYFGLITWPILVCSTLLTCFIGILHYDTCTRYSISLFLVTIHFECLILALVKQLTSIVGGSCVGYALVAPAFETRENGLFSGRNVQILSQQDAYDSSQRCMTILNNLERFMITNLIDIFGCDYSSSGITMNFLDTKLNSFFAHRTSDGRRYDTYLFYFSGPTCDHGDIILADNQKLTLNLLLQWWYENETASSTSRLILVFDTFNSHKWLKQIRCQTFHNSCKPSVFLVLQTFNRQKKLPKLIELGQIHLGVFTEIWLRLNENNETSKTSYDAYASWRANHLEPKCSFSYYYPEFNFRQPTNADVDIYLNEHSFLKRLHLIYHFLTYIPSLVIYPFLYTFNCIKRWRFHLLMPRVIDTYHGFKLFVR